ncbi:MAG TPA: 1-acyl-sn-glycerol-3-phosphate acyltransferase [Bacteroidales bacterium]|nr:1-acyl-sn-glycerol-3-phosphate acyltransferase [Bacteroidales bacterium]HPI87078.1 1-acyl-sn-glycerol-3-phosphate acyltransferase [Bacteroidales bacterium]HPM93356.1 1-acyl-sn-glycerol-3-phosphate acyltransferase [Bacteroidales bacterium]
MSRKTIGRFSFGFQIVLWIGGIFHRMYYRKFSVVNRERIPHNGPVIFAANHQNALMDALAVIFSTRRQVVFLARADIFRKKYMARILYFLKILPVYRIRDGFHAVDQNNEVFPEIIGVLKRNRPAGLFPEGNHLGEKRLRPLKKGAARLALQAEEANDFTLGVTIVPVGLDYSNYYNAGSDLLVVFGNPIPALAYREEYLRNPAQAVSHMTTDLATELRKVMLDIRSEENYSVIHEAVKMYGPVERKRRKLRNNPYNLFLIKKELAENLMVKEKGLETLREELASYHAKLPALGIRDSQITSKIENRKSKIGTFIALFLLPIHLYGIVLNYIPYGLPIFLARNIKDRHFLGSVRFGAGLLLFFTWYLLLFITSIFIFHNIFYAAVFMVSVSLTGLCAFYNYRLMLKLRADWRWIFLKYRNRSEFEGLIKQRERIMKEIFRLLYRV